MLPPAHRVAARTNWHTVELTLEGLIFLVMGLEFFGIVEEVDSADLGLWRAVEVAIISGFLTVAVRAIVVAPMLTFLRQEAVVTAGDDISGATDVNASNGFDQFTLLGFFAIQFILPITIGLTPC